MSEFATIRNLMIKSQQYILYNAACLNLPRLWICTDSPTEHLLEAELRHRIGVAGEKVVGRERVDIPSLLLERARELNPGRCLTLSIEQDLDRRAAVDAYAVSIFKDEFGNYGISNGGKAVYRAKLLKVPEPKGSLKDYRTEKLLELMLRSKMNRPLEENMFNRIRAEVIHRAYRMPELRYLTLRSFLPGARLNRTKKCVPQLCAHLFTDLDDGRREPILCVIKMRYDRQERVTVYDTGISTNLA
jgi:hypothetical protein